MRGLNLNPSRVYQTTSLLLESKTIRYPPSWYTTIGTYPPSEILTRTQPVQHRRAKPKSRVRKPSKMFMPQPIVYEEDLLRQQFYADHPWELARPRIILENDGRDGQKADWSRIQQPHLPLCGESVVQRQLWLIQNGHKGRTLEKAEAYDIARKEFYALRHTEEIEVRVAREEAMYAGAYFNKSVLDISMGIEDNIYEEWKDWALKEIELKQQIREASNTSIPTKEPDELSASDELFDESADAQLKPGMELS